MIEFIQGLPPFEGFKLPQTPDQKAYVRRECQIWKAIGKRLDFLQRQHLGFRVKDPAKALPIQIKDLVVVESELFYRLLDVLVDGFDVIEAYAHKHNRDIPYSPRETLSVICFEYAGRRLRRTIATDHVEGVNLKTIRATESHLGKFIRGSLEKETQDAMLERMENSGYVVDFCICALYRDVGLKRLKLWDSWKNYAKAQTAYRRFINRKDVLALKWLDGKTVYTATDSPAGNAFLT
jgi:hypothetical protein